MRIGNLIIENPIVAAPMAGVTDFPYRQIIREMGCELLYTEMVSSKGLVYNNQKTCDLLDYCRKDGRIGVQIFGKDPVFMQKAAKFIVEENKPDIIDINMGCPAPKIIKNGYGAVLMKSPEIVHKIVRAVVEAVDIPVTVKIRSGWSKSSINAREIALIAEEAGASAIAVHGRTREQFYKGEADWSVIRDVKSSVNIPVIGNGDVFTPLDARKMMDYTGCDGVMVARGIQGNPWLIKRSFHFLLHNEYIPEPSPGEKIKMALYHLKKAINYYGEGIGIPRMRKHLGWYLKGMPYSGQIKDRINQLNDYVKIKQVFSDYKKLLH